VGKPTQLVCLGTEQVKWSSTGKVAWQRRSQARLFFILFFKKMASLLVLDPAVIASAIAVDLNPTGLEMAVIPFFTRR